jgi:cell division protein DivIC
MIFIIQKTYSPVHKFSFIRLKIVLCVSNFMEISTMPEQETKQERIIGISMKRLRNKYLLATLLFILWVSFFDQNNWFERLQILREIRQLKIDKEYYQQKIKEDCERLKELKTNNENLEKFAREQYLMKKENEDVFVIVED